MFPISFGGRVPYAPRIWGGFGSVHRLMPQVYEGSCSSCGADGRTREDGARTNMSGEDDPISPEFIRAIRIARYMTVRRLYDLATTCYYHTTMTRRLFIQG